MFYSMDLSGFPVVSKVYSVTRKTVWQVADAFNILIYVTKGSCQFSVNGEDYIVSEGNAFFIPERQNYIRRPLDDTFCTMTYIHFKSGKVSYLSPEEIKSEIIERRDKINQSILENGIDENPYTAYLSGLCSFNGNTEKAEALFSALSKNFSRHHIESGFATSLNLCEILQIFTEETMLKIQDETRLERAVPPPLRKALSYIKQNCTEEISLSDIAKHCSLTKQQIIRYFRSEMNTTPMQYVTEYRLNRAMELFWTSTVKTVSEAANEVGFSDPHYFSRAFKKFTGETPTEYISRIKSFDEKKHLEE